MPTVEANIEIQSFVNEVFDLAQSYDLRLEWDPFLKAMRFLDGAKEADKGVKVWVKAYNGLTMTVEYISLKRPNSVAMQMTKGPFIFKKFSGSWRFKTLENGQTQVTFRYNYEGIFGKLNPFIFDKMMNRIFQKDIEARLKGLKIYAEKHFPSKKG
jgi:ribosome-associated toxin RatA of RatAB toxin-antitoxin module